MKLPLKLTFNLFKQKIYAFDREIVYVKGVPKKITSDIYHFQGILQKASLANSSQKFSEFGQDLEIDQSLHTDKKLYAFDANQTQVTTRQSFIIDNYEVDDNGNLTENVVLYKVVNLSNMSKHISGNINKYALVKYIDLDENADEYNEY